MADNTEHLIRLEQQLQHLEMAIKSLSVAMHLLSFTGNGIPLELHSVYAKQIADRDAQSEYLHRLIQKGN